MAITAELIKNSTGECPSRHDLWLMVKVGPFADNYYAATITFRDPFTYKDISRTKYVREVPTDRDYADMIVHALHYEHPNINFTWTYDNTTHRITVEQQPKFIHSRYGTTMAPPSWHEKSKEDETMPRFTKVAVNGPATIAWVTTGRNPAKKVVIKKADGDAYDLEKAMLMCWAKSWFSDDTDFHKWFRLNMKMFKEAYDKDHPDVGELPAVDAKAISENINATLERMSKALHNYKDRLNSVYGKAAVDGDDVVEEFKERFNATEVQEPGAPWTWDEISFLHRHYSSKSTKSIAMALGRSECAVRSKAKRLGIKKGGNTHG